MIDTEEAGSCPVCGAPGGSCRPSYEGVGLMIVQEEEIEEMGSVELKDRTYLDKDGKATVDPEMGVSLLGIAGDVISEEEAERVGLSAEEEGMSLADLRAKAKEMGLSAAGSKAALQERILAAAPAYAPAPEEVEE